MIADLATAAELQELTDRLERVEHHLETLARRAEAQVLNLAGVAELLGMTPRQVSDTVRAGNMPQPIITGTKSTTWRWSSLQFLAPAAIPSGAGCDAGASPRPTREAPAPLKAAS